MSIDREQLTQAATQARKQAYCPYSRYQVGAAVLGENGIIYQGCNVENASFGATICAERVAMLTMVAAGCKRFTAIAVATGDEFDSAPCCLCRQVMTEFCTDLALPVYMVTPSGKIYAHSLGEIAPLPFMRFEPNQ